MRVLFLAIILCFISLSATASDICPMCDDYEVVQIEAAYEDALAKATYAYTHLKEVSADLILAKQALRYNYWYSMSENLNDWWLNYYYEQVLRTATGVYGALKTRDFIIRNATPEEEQSDADNSDGSGGCLKNGQNVVRAFVDYQDKDSEKKYGMILCARLWSDNATIDVWGRVIIHELAHNFGTGDIAYCGSGACLDLEDQFASGNTDSFAWFGANDTYFQMESHDTGDRLVPGVPIKQMELEESTELHFRLEVPAGVPNVTVSLTPSASDAYGDADLYISESGWPDIDNDDWDFRSWNYGNNEQLSFIVDEGTYYITVHAYDDFSEVGLIAEFQ